MSVDERGVSRFVEYGCVWKKVRWMKKCNPGDVCITTNETVNAQDSEVSRPQ